MIKFRDSKNMIEGGGRFGFIEEEVDWDASNVIEAIKTAILKEKENAGITLEEAKKKQEESDSILSEKAKEAEINNKKDAVVKQII